MLKSKRIEYTFEYFRSLLPSQLEHPERLTLKEKADQNFINDLRFLSTRMISISYIVGLNCAALGYFGMFRHLRKYIGVPLAFVAFSLGKSLTTKSLVNRMYYPIEPLYNEVRSHQTVSAATPTGARGVRDIEKANKLLGESRVPLMERTDLTKADKRKILKQTEATRNQTMRSAAQQMAENDLKKAEEFMENLVEQVHG